tara:strand:+ start:45 stop:575 length:531 start_codon:yes stop_codon:yes gene_type:complete
MIQPEPTFQAAIPGSSLTAEQGSRAYKKPPQYSTVDDAMDYYVTRLSSDEVADQIVSVLDMGVPVTEVANIMQMHGVMEGKHTLDMSMLMLPVLMEIIALIGDTANIDYNMGTEKSDPERSENSIVQTAKMKMETELRDKTLEGFSKDKEPEMDEEIEEEAEEPVTEPTGLMARRG